MNTNCVKLPVNAFSVSTTILLYLGYYYFYFPLSLPFGMNREGGEFQGAGIKGKSKLIFRKASSSVICPKAGPSLQTQAPRLQFCPKAGLPL